MANVTAKLRVLDMRGETTNTRWGSVTFDAAGLAEVEVPEEELEMLRSCRPFSWLASDHGRRSGRGWSRVTGRRAARAGRSPTTARVRSSSRSGGRAVVTSPRNASNMPATATASVRQTSSRFSALMSLDDLDGEYLLDNYLTGFRFEGADGQELSPIFYDEKIANAIAKLEEITGIDVLERDVVSEKHDYHTTDYMNYAYVQLFRIPCQSVSEVRAVYPTGQTIQVFRPSGCA